jgi:transformer-2 protein
VYKAEIMLDPHTRTLARLLSFDGLYGIADLLGESRGFGFVKMDTSDDANAAIEKLNGTSQEGKVMTVAHVSRACLPRQ